MTKISATIITLNEEKMLPKCLESLKGLADEIILVDSGSTDKTLEIAKRYNAKIYHRNFDNFASQKNFALQKTSGDWVFSIDADERIDKDLKEEIKKTVEESSFNGYLIPRRNFILGAEIKHSRWSPDKHIWLWKKGSGKWQGEVHEEININGGVGFLKNAKLHFQDRTIGEFIKTNNKYSDLKAVQLHNLGIQLPFFRMFWDPFFEFSIRYIYKLGFLDGWRGFVLAVLMAYYKFQIWFKLNRLRS